MQTSENNNGAALTRDSFRRAKVELYLQRAEDYFRMARYKAALKTTEKLLSLEPRSPACTSLQERAEAMLRLFSQRGKDESGTAYGISQLTRKRSRNDLVMVVDQDERVLLSLAEGLQRYGFDVVAAAGYDEAVETLATIRPNLIISEVNFQDGPVGFDLYLWVRTNASLHDIPFLFLATRIDRETLIAGKRLGVDDFILKPLDKDVVTAFVVNCISRHKKQTAGIRGTRG